MIFSLMPGKKYLEGITRSAENLAELSLVSTTPFFVLFLSLSIQTNTHTKPGLVKYLTLF